MMEGYCLVISVTGLNRPNTGKNVDNFNCQVAVGYGRNCHFFLSASVLPLITPECIPQSSIPADSNVAALRSTQMTRAIQYRCTGKASGKGRWKIGTLQGSRTRVSVTGCIGKPGTGCYSWWHSSASCQTSTIRARSDIHPQCHKCSPLIH